LPEFNYGEDLKEQDSHSPNLNVRQDSSPNEFDKVMRVNVDVADGDEDDEA